MERKTTDPSATHKHQRIKYLSCAHLAHVLPWKHHHANGDDSSDGNLDHKKRKLYKQPHHNNTPLTPNIPLTEDASNGAPVQARGSAQGGQQERVNQVSAVKVCALCVHRRSEGRWPSGAAIMRAVSVNGQMEAGLPK